ncbi:Cytosolic Fe-S cluster assembly factor NUBP2 homolog [Eumeta japonica]|uniref:Cytosolic Fe-S cluster assembly factor NUBP2 homolog n=1 Tax=Eumeta variegata TaxID=151549 RepID=A0A4C1Y115_EUMVA|nr:Cytosolic Fe-S cluster assembly factor NUBP2 homolog [Eumeta japonica]
MLDDVKHIVLVLSGKGGVGKSTVSTQLALTLKENGYKVGLLDIDLCGPSVPYILNLEEQNVHQGPDGWIPVYMDNDQKLGVMSIGFLLNSRNDAVVWRGPKKTSMIKQFLEDVCWQDVDYLIIDTPPGTSDEHITVMENLRKFPQCGAILVTTPQQVAIEDVRKEITFCRKTGIKIFGIVENMSGYECPNCSECTNIFSSGGGQSLAEISKIPFFGSVPIDPRVGKLAGQGLAAIKELPDSITSKVFSNLVRRLEESSSNARGPWRLLWLRPPALARLSSSPAAAKSEAYGASRALTIAAADDSEAGGAPRLCRLSWACLSPSLNAVGSENSDNPPGLAACLQPAYCYRHCRETRSPRRLRCPPDARASLIYLYDHVKSEESGKVTKSSPGKHHFVI